MIKEKNKKLLYFLIGGIILLSVFNFLIYSNIMISGNYATIFLSAWLIGGIAALIVFFFGGIKEVLYQTKLSLIMLLVFLLIYIIRFPATRGVLTSLFATPIVLENEVIWYLPTCGYLFDFMFGFFLVLSIICILSIRKNKSLKMRKKNLAFLFVPLIAGYFDTLASVLHRTFFLASNNKMITAYKTIGKIIPPALVWYLISFCGTVLLTYLCFNKVVLSPKIAVIGMVISLCVLLLPEYMMGLFGASVTTSPFVQNIIGVDYHATIFYVGAIFVLSLKSLRYTQ